jgi:hypothetical protein
VPYESYEALANAAVLGDEEAVEALAQRLRAVDEMSAKGQPQAKPQMDQDFAQGALEVITAHPDVWGDEEARQRWIEVDGNLSAKFPQMGYRERLAFGVDVVREILGDPESRDYSNAIANMRTSRTVPRKLREGVVHERLSASLAPEDAEIESDRSAAIREMIEARKPRPAPMPKAETERA